MGLLPEAHLAEGPEETDLEKKSPIGNKSGGRATFTTKPGAVVQVPEQLQGVPIPSNPDLKQ
jgi:hypothetical protein